MKSHVNFGRSLLAAAVAGCCGYASAATVGTGGGIAVTDAAVLAAGTSADFQLATLNVTLGAAYTSGNAVTLSLQNGAQFSGNAANIRSSLQCAASAGSAAAANTEMVMAYQSGGTSGSTAVTYVVQSISAGQVTNGLICSFGPRHILTRTIPASGAAGVSFSARTDSTSNGTPIDNGVVATGTISTASGQFVFASVSGVSGTVDVTTGRLLFTAAPTAKPSDPAIQVAATGGNAAKTADAIQFRTSHVSLGASTSATQQTFEVSFTGDFAFVDDTGGECSGADLTGGAGTIVARDQITGGASADASGRLTISTNCQTLTYKISPADAAAFAPAAGAVTAVYHTISMRRATDSTGLAFPVGSYGYSTPSFGSYGGTSATGGGVASTTGAGSFGSNGLVVDVPYMPFNKVNGTDVGHVIVWNNRSAQAAALSVTATKTGATSSSAGTACATNSNLVTINANSVQNISDVVRSYVQACFPGDYAVGATGGPRVSLRFEANLPAASNELYTSFTIGSDRAFVGNSSTGRGAPRSN